MQGSGNAGFEYTPQPEAQESGPSDGFIPEVAAAVQGTELVNAFMPELEVPGWDLAESIFPESSSQADSMALFSEETAPTKLYEPKRHKKESGFAFPEPEQAAETAGNDWMIYG